MEGDANLLPLKTDAAVVSPPVVGEGSRAGLLVAEQTWRESRKLQYHQYFNIHVNSTYKRTNQVAEELLMFCLTYDLGSLVQAPAIDKFLENYFIT